MKAGFAERDITPNNPGLMPGYVARVEPWTGVLDPIMARACVLDDHLAIVVLDWVWVTTELVETVRTTTKIPNVILCATHTHSGPLPHDVSAELVDLIVEARNQATDRDLRFGSATVEGLAANRRDPNGPCDTTVSVLSFGDDVLATFACHPTTLGHTNTQLSADFPGLASTAWNGTALVTTGACGDISTRFTRDEQSHSQALRFGDLLHSGMEEAVKNSRPITGDEVSVERRTFDLKEREPLDLDAAIAIRTEAQAALEQAKADGASEGDLRIAITRLEGSQILLARIGGQPEAKQVEINRIQIGDIGILTTNLELLTQTGRELTDDFDMVIGYADGYAGYLVPPFDGDGNDYEAMVATIDSSEYGRFLASVR